MANTLEKIRKVIAAHVPGTAINLAQQKRAMEKRLRAEGHSKKDALVLTVQHFAKQLKEHT